VIQVLIFGTGYIFNYFRKSQTDLLPLGRLVNRFKMPSPEVPRFLGAVKKESYLATLSGKLRSHGGGYYLPAISRLTPQY